MDSLLDYIPVVGDLYRAGKMGWKVGSILGDYWYGDNQTLTKGVEHLKNAIDSDNPSITKAEAEKAVTLFNQSESDRKYQLAFIYYLRSHCYYLIAISNIAIGNDNVKKNFNNAISDLNSVCEIETTLLTTKKDTILELQAEAKSHILEVKDVKEKWLKFDKEQHPWKYRLRWIIPIIIIICLGIIAFILYEKFTENDYGQDEILEEIVSEEPEEEVVEEEIIEDDVEVIPSFNFEAYRYYRSSEDADIELKTDFPLGSSVVADSVRQYIHEIFGGQYRCSYEDAQDILDYYGDKKFRDYEKVHQETVKNIESNDDDDDEETYTVSAYKSWTYFKVACIEDRFVTYKVESYFWTGGIHEMEGEYGVTFNRLNGKRVNYSYFRNLESSSFKRIIKEGLKRYFQNNDWAASDDEELAGCLLSVENVDDIPLPSAKPYFTPKGVCFKYGSYEIASYAAGFPSFVLPFDEARPYMTQEALNLIEGYDY